MTGLIAFIDSSFIMNKNAKSHYDWLVKGGIVGEDAYKQALLGHINSKGIYLYSYNKATGLDFEERAIACGCLLKEQFNMPVYTLYDIRCADGKVRRWRKSLL